MICNENSILTVLIIRMSIVEDLLAEKIFNFLWKVIKLIGAFVRLPFAGRKLNLEELSKQNLSGVIGLLFVGIIIAVILL